MAGFSWARTPGVPLTSGKFAPQPAIVKTIAEAGWILREVTPPVGTFEDLLTVVGTKDGPWVAAGTNGRIRRSDDGIDWNEVLTPATLSPTAASINPDTGVICVAWGSNLGVWRSADGGATWANVVPGPEFVQDVEYIRSIGRWVVLFGPNGGNGGALAWSDNDGATWSDDFAARTLPQKIHTGIAWGNGFYFVDGRDIAGTNRQVMRSASIGGPWTPLNHGSTSNMLDILCPAEDQRIVMITNSTKILISGDSGNTWEEALHQIVRTVTLMSIEVDPVTLTAYIVTSSTSFPSGLLQSRSYGHDWSSMLAHPASGATSVSANNGKLVIVGDRDFVATLGV